MPQRVYNHVVETSWIHKDRLIYSVQFFFWLLLDGSVINKSWEKLHPEFLTNNDYETEDDVPLPERFNRLREHIDPHINEAEAPEWATGRADREIWTVNW